MSHTRLTLRLACELIEIERLTSVFEGAFRSYSISQYDRYSVLLALEEVVSNVMRHGAVEGRQLCISVGSTLSESGVRLQVVDDGVPFDPLLHVYAHSTEIQPTESGGWGIQLVKSLMDNVRYRRRGSFNCLTFSKSFAQVQRARA